MAQPQNYRSDRLRNNYGFQQFSFSVVFVLINWRGCVHAASRRRLRVSWDNTTRGNVHDTYLTSRSGGTFIALRPSQEEALPAGLFVDR